MHVAVDLGADSGRVLAGRFDGERLTVTEAHRFPNQPIRGPHGALHTDARVLRAKVTEGIARAAAQGEITSVGVDAWGNDFGLLDRDGRLLADPRHHRDPYTSGLDSRVSSQEQYELTGVLPAPINTSCQLLAHAGSPLLEQAERLVMLPDLFTHWLSGQTLTERTIASTSQLMDIRAGQWAVELISALGLPGRLFGHEIVEPGTPAGPLRGCGDADGATVMAVAGHDTACAVAALPAVRGDVGFICCGTWSLVGIERSDPVTLAAARHAGFTNEAGLAGTVRFLRNLNGLWLLQECRRAWGSRSSHAELVAQAASAPPFGPLIDPGHVAFLRPGDMPARIAGFCRATGQRPPGDRAATVRCVLESLACSFRRALEQAEHLGGRRVGAVHLVGGGAASPVLCRLTADFGGRPVLAGPVEASGYGNLLIQVMAGGGIGTLAELRDVVRRSSPPRVYEPDGTRGRYEEAYARYLRMTDIDVVWSKVAPNLSTEE
ncbi:rhamnulokinase family protein [Nonomuraea sp. NPDC050663]|uniref:rhamnulokinase family protein n=1 Tax=Nonomuraea sp. NPDC050663 TaxID=3364370 RepID=UPI0037B9F848